MISVFIQSFDLPIRLPLNFCLFYIEFVEFEFEKKGIFKLCVHDGGGSGSRSINRTN